jgi:leucyl/phenylalanyl-tRNA--protein transferase
MPTYLIHKELKFPPVSLADPNGLLAVGGDLSIERLLLAYRSGIFPWFNDGDPVLWWSPDPRCLLLPQNLKVSKSMRNILNRGELEVRYDQAFSAVIRKCRNTKRKEDGTWITIDIVQAYEELHEAGYAHSVEVYKDDKLCGGLYGVSLGAAFFGESMFSEYPNASKAALITLAKDAAMNGMDFIDCQLYTDHLASMGALNFERGLFITKLQQTLKKPTLRGNWSDESIWHRLRL